MLIFNKRGSRGDTIVEVLIALAVLSVILVGAFATANHSQLTNRASQERGEAIKVAESQIESLKVLLARTNPAAPIPPASGAYCVNSANTNFDVITSPANPFSESLESATLPYSGSCGNQQGRYNVAVTTTSTDTYSFLVRWDRVGGGRDQINMYYRVH